MATGSGGGSIAAAVFAAVPLGLPKLLVTTMGQHLGSLPKTRDVTLMQSVTDIAGLNRVSRRMLRNAAFARGRDGGGATARPRWTRASRSSRSPCSAITTPGVLQVERRLRDAGFETITFHAVGTGGRAMEEMIQAGTIDGVIDYTVSELTDELLGGIFPAGPERLEAAGRAGIPQVVVPGAIEVLNFGPRATRCRASLRHARAPADRAQRERLRRAHHARRRPQSSGASSRGSSIWRPGPTAVVLPLAGFDAYQTPPDGPWIDAAADAPFLRGCAARAQAGHRPGRDRSQHQRSRFRGCRVRAVPGAVGAAPHADGWPHDRRAASRSRSEPRRRCMVAGVGQRASAAAGAVAGGADLLAVYNTAIYRQRNLPSILAFLPGDDPNRITAEAAPGRRRQCGRAARSSSGSRPTIRRLTSRGCSTTCERLAGAGVTNEPFAGLYGAAFNAELERSGCGFSREVALDRGRRAPRSARRLAGPATPARRPGWGTRVPQMIGLDARASPSRAARDAARCSGPHHRRHGGERAAGQSRGSPPRRTAARWKAPMRWRFVLSRCDVDGYVTGSSLERGPVIEAVADRMRRFREASRPRSSRPKTKASGPL